jgi:DNA replication and repair protein RecF
LLIEKLLVRSFRLFDEKQVEFKPGINVISGLNATGKTTLLEGIYLLMAGRSFRTPQMSDLFQSGSTGFFVDVRFEKSGVKQALKMSQSSSERGLFHNSTALPNLGSLLGVLQGVLHSPQDIDLVKGSPSVRRHYLDLQMAQVDPLLVHHLLRYSKGLKSRNALLKSGKPVAIEGFEESMGFSASYILLKRKSLVHELEGLLKGIYQEMSGKEEPISLQYRSSLGTAEEPAAIFEKFAAHRRRDMEMGYTSVGPHRDDLKIQIHEREVKSSASEGEMRTLGAALRLSEWHRMRRMMQEPPMLFIDDFGISLDPHRVSGMSKILRTLGQVIITSAADRLDFGEEAHVLSI